MKALIFFSFSIYMPGQLQNMQPLVQASVNFEYNYLLSVEPKLDKKCGRTFHFAIKQEQCHWTRSEITNRNALYAYSLQLKLVIMITFQFKYLLFDFIIVNLLILR